MQFNINATPGMIPLNTQDASGRQVPRVPEAVPSHCPKVFLFAQKGDATLPHLLLGAERDALYGTATFDPLSPFYNHATKFSDIFNSRGNACMYQRVVPDDAPDPASLTLWLDVLPVSDLPVYERTVDGAFVYDDNGDKIPVANQTVSGFKVKWVVNPTIPQGQNGQVVTQMQGDQTSQLQQSTRYRIFDFTVGWKGSQGNNCGVKLWVPTINNTAGNMPTKLMDEERVYPFRLSMIERANGKSSPTVITSQLSEQFVELSLKSGVIDPISTSLIDAEKVLIGKYQNLDDPTYPYVYGNFSNFTIYRTNLEQLLTQFYQYESQYLKPWHDFAENTLTDMWLFNIFTGVTSNDSPYQTFVLVDDNTSTRLSDQTPLYATGGGDGTMSEAKFSLLVQAQMARYLDKDDRVQDMAENVESIIYDSGFDLDAKYALCNFIARRPDTFVVLGTHVAGGSVLTNSQEYALAIALRTRLQAYPESQYFGTPVMRGLVFSRAGILINDQFQTSLPLTADLAGKAADYMGASNGKWKNGKLFDRQPGSIIQSMRILGDVSISATTRNRFWNVGLNWPQKVDTRTYFHPALQTVYPDDTSVLNNFFTAMAICDITKIQYKAWQQFSGAIDLTDAQLIEAHNNFIISQIDGKFDNLYVIVPDCQVTDMDKIRGFSWTSVVNIYANVPKTAQFAYVRAFRQSDLTNA